MKTYKIWCVIQWLFLWFYALQPNFSHINFYVTVCLYKSSCIDIFRIYMSWTKKILCTVETFYKLSNICDIHFQIYWKICDIYITNIRLSYRNWFIVYLENVKKISIIYWLVAYCLKSFRYIFHSDWSITIAIIGLQTYVNFFVSHFGW